eukprot:scaffold263760_cov23-Tisochrysis_lutea.AAC.1
MKPCASQAHQHQHTGTQRCRIRVRFCYLCFLLLTVDPSLQSYILPSSSSSPLTPQAASSMYPSPTSPCALRRRVLHVGVLASSPALQENSPGIESFRLSLHSRQRTPRSREERRRESKDGERRRGKRWP